MSTEITTSDEPDVDAAVRHPVLAVLLVVGGVLGLIASFALTKDDLALLANPSASLGCSFSDKFQCGKNIMSWQGKVFGFPNPLLGLMMFPAPIVVGMALLGRVRFPRWFWLVFNGGMWFAIGFIAWLAYESIFDIGTLCPWCSVVYAAVIPMWLAVTVHNMTEGRVGTALQRVGVALRPWILLITAVLYAVILVTAQVKLDILGSL
ncbi:vitamin K epoxide reductase family protein [Tsukamurella sp. 8F]|uniref:vitamin K epoxide reductase family protein n=1 Tax=unclassified Tsukamurella TaxID=2633480 RepID=UPI0023B97BBE|nr:MULTISPECIES: vitamin K epoxide reductase family protein [unclassified Tsukamurella]MDF0529440.1 vitamin K epoxide reductase family protein [Tsukamurella sp. 8J]MDF0589349.1 vitamin K epoxide reductase family protein [Tsukamurella sp. 8F]